jgi:predicted nucleic acid-binding protein
MDLIADTSLLIGVWRSQPWAREFINENGSKTLGIPWVVLGEFWHGAIRAGHDEASVRRFLSIGLPVMDPEPVVHVYGRICAELGGQNAYRSIGQNDLWIAATAIAMGKPLATRNVRHFDRIEGLQLEILEK